MIKELIGRIKAYRDGLNHKTVERLEKVVLLIYGATGGVVVVWVYLLWDIWNLEL